MIQHRATRFSRACQNPRVGGYLADMTDQQRTLRAFVIMPFDADFEAVYTDLIHTPLTEVGYEVTRADSLLNQRNILADVVTGIANADLIIADVTGLNPNVMYELGLAHGLGKRTVMITQRLETLPFDLRPYRANEYTTNFQNAERLAVVLTEIARAVASGSADFSNPVQDYAPNQLVSNAQVSLPPNRSAEPSTAVASHGSSGESNSEGDSDQDLGFLDGLDLLQRGAEKVNDISLRMGEKTNGVGAAFTEGSAKLENIRKNLGSDRALPPSLAVMRNTAKELDSYSDAMTFMNQELNEALRDAISGANAVARYRQRPDADVEALRGEYESIEKLTETLAESYASTGSFAATLGDLPPIEGRLTKAAARAATVVSETAAILSTAQAEFDRVRAVMKGRLDIE